MKPSKQRILVCALSILLVACDANQGTDKSTATPAVTVAPATEVTMPVAVADRSETPFPEPGQFTIDLTPGNISIRAAEIDELELLEQIAASAGFELLTADIQWSTVTVDVHADNLHAALTELLSAYPYQIVYKQDKNTQSEVLSEVFVSPDLVPAKLAKTVKATSSAEAGPEDTALSASEDDLPDAEMVAQLQALKSDSETTRAAAAEDIEPTGEALIALTGLLSSDPSPEVRIASTRALEFSDDPLAIQALVACLKDEYPAVIVECIKSLEHIGDSRNVAQLQPLLEHFDASVRMTAAEAIDNLQ